MPRCTPSRSRLIPIHPKNARNHRSTDSGLVVDLGPRYAVANPLGVHLSGYLAKFVARAYHLYALPRLVNRWAVALAYLTDVLFPPHRVVHGIRLRRRRPIHGQRSLPATEGGRGRMIFNDTIVVLTADAPPGLFPAREQMAVSLGWHIVLACFGILPDDDLRDVPAHHPP